jgi:hypothetical protein
MEGTPAIYQGRILSDMDRMYFRAYIYDSKGCKKLINSWNEFEHHMETGIWFSSLDDLNKKTNTDNVKKLNPQTKDNKNEVLLGHKK